MKRAILTAVLLLAGLAEPAAAGGRCERGLADCIDACGDQYTCRLRCIADYKDCDDSISSEQHRKIRESIRCERDRNNCKSTCPYDAHRGECTKACDEEFACE